MSPFQGANFLVVSIFLRTHCQVSPIVCVTNIAKRMHGLVSRRLDLALNPLIFEPEDLVALDDAARGRLGEMCCTHHHVAVAIPLQETPPRGSCEGGVKIGAHDPLWFHTLHGTVDAFSGNDRLGALRCQVNADMPWGMAWCGFRPDFAVKRKVAA